MGERLAALAPNWGCAAAQERFFPPTMTSEKKSPGEKFRDALALERPLQVTGAINPFSDLLAKEAGFRAIYLSGAGVANASFGLPDSGMTSASDVCEDIRRITAAERIYRTIREAGSQANAVSLMQTRERLYEILDYHRYERKLDELFGSNS